MKKMMPCIQLKSVLHHGITSQVIFKDNINNPSFNYFLPNIAIALLAKLGIPGDYTDQLRMIWLLASVQTIQWLQETIYWSILFKNDGSFKGFNAFESGNTTALAGSIKQSIENTLQRTQVAND